MPPKAKGHPASAFVIANPRGPGFSPAWASRRWHVERDESLAHARSIADATDLPVSADLERGFGDAPENGGRDHQTGGRGGTGGMHDRPARLPRRGFGGHVRMCADLPLTRRLDGYTEGR